MSNAMKAKFGAQGVQQASSVTHTYLARALHRLVCVRINEAVPICKLHLAAAIVDIISDCIAHYVTGKVVRCVKTLVTTAASTAVSCVGGRKLLPLLLKALVMVQECAGEQRDVDPTIALAWTKPKKGHAAAAR